MVPVKLIGERQRALAKSQIDAAPAGWIVTVKEPTRSLDANARMWAMLTDISLAQPLGRQHTADTWKLILMSACGHECQFETGIDGRPFPVGFRSSRLTVKQMSDFIEYLFWFGATYGVAWSEPHPDERAA